MSYLKLEPNGLEYSFRQYGGLGNLRRIMARNDDSFESFINLASRTIPDQNPLVQFIRLFAVNVEWTEQYLINVIDAKINNNASAVNFTSLYNRGKNFTNVVYPETNHNTLMVVPFHKPSTSQINGYFNNELNSLVPFFPIYTTDTIQRFDIMPLMDTKKYSCDRATFSIVQIDVYALIIGYWRWLKLNRDVGASMHAYLVNYPIMNFYEYHNELATYNYLSDRWSEFKVQQGSFSIEPFATQLRDYTDHKNRYMMKEHMDSFTNFIQINEVINMNVDPRKMIFPEMGKSTAFMQLAWVWTIASLGMVDKYMHYTNLLGTVDGVNEAKVKAFYKFPVNTIKGQIKADYWEQHFMQLYNKVKTYI